MWVSDTPTQEQIDGMTPDQLKLVANDLLEKLNKVKCQIESAKARRIETGEFMPPKWMYGKKRVKRDIALAHQRVLSRLSELKKRDEPRHEPIKTHKDMLEIARRVLPATEFRKLIEAARAETIV